MINKNKYIEGNLSVTLVIYQELLSGSWNTCRIKMAALHLGEKLLKFMFKRKLLWRFRFSTNPSNRTTVYAQFLLSSAAGLLIWYGETQTVWSTGVPFLTRRIPVVQTINFVPIFITCTKAQNVIEYAQSSDANAYARGNVWTYAKSLHSSNLHTSFSLDLFRFSVIHYTPS